MAAIVTHHRGGFWNDTYSRRRRWSIVPLPSFYVPRCPELNDAHTQTRGIPHSVSHQSPNSKSLQSCFVPLDQTKALFPSSSSSSSLFFFLVKKNLTQKLGSERDEAQEELPGCGRGGMKPGPPSLPTDECPFLMLSFVTDTHIMVMVLLWVVTIIWPFQSRPAPALTSPGLSGHRPKSNPSIS